MVSLVHCSRFANSRRETEGGSIVHYCGAAHCKSARDVRYIKHVVATQDFCCEIGVEVEVVVPPAAAAPRIADAEELAPLQLFQQYVAARNLAPEVSILSAALHHMRSFSLDKLAPLQLFHGVCGGAQPATRGVGGRLDYETASTTTVF